MSDFYDTPEVAARRALRYALNHGGALAIDYGQTEIDRACVLGVSKQSAKVQDLSSGQITDIAIGAITAIAELS